MPYQQPRSIRRCTQVGIPDYVQVCVSGKAECVTDTVPSRTFNVNDYFGVRGYFQARVQRQDVGHVELRLGLQAVRPAVWRAKGRVPLADNIDLP